MSNSTGLLSFQVKNRIRIVLFFLFPLASTLAVSNDVSACQAIDADETYDLRGDCFGVEDKDETPLPDVELKLFLVDNVKGTQELVSELTSDMAGRFQFSELVKPKSQPNDHARYVLLVRHPGYATARFDQSSWLASKNELKILLLKAKSLAGEFKDNQGKPISGLTFFESTYLMEPVKGYACTETGKNGKFELKDISQPPLRVGNRQYYKMFRGIHPEYGRFSLMLSELVDPLEIELSPASEISGRVLDDDNGKPVADCIVVASLAHTRKLPARFPGGMIEPATWLTTRTDKQGNYKFTFFANSNYNIWTHETKKMAAAIQVSTGSSQQVRLKEIRLQKTIPVTGQLIDADTNKPFAKSIRVSWHGPARPKSGSPVQGAVTKDDGSFTFQMVPGINYPYIGTNDSEFVYRSTEVVANGEPKGKNGISVSRDEKTELKIFVEKIPRQ